MSVEKERQQEGVEVPEFGTLEEEAKFFDNTSFADLADDQLTEVEVERPRAPKTTTFAIRLDRKTVQLLREIAKLYDIGPTQLARAWIKHRINVELRAGVLAPPITDLPPQIETSMRRIFVRKAIDDMGSLLEQAMEQSWQQVKEMAPELMAIAKVYAEEFHEGPENNTDRLIDQFARLKHLDTQDQDSRGRAGSTSSADDEDIELWGRDNDVEGKEGRAN